MDNGRFILFCVNASQGSDITLWRNLMQDDRKLQSDSNAKTLNPWIMQLYLKPVESKKGYHIAGG